jgi:prophage regulatory protein
MRDNIIASAEDRIIRDAECKRLSGLSRTTRWRLERKGKFPKRRQLSESAIGWLLSEILEWRTARPTVRSSADDAGPER